MLECLRSDQGLVVAADLALGPTLGALTAFQQPPQLVALLLAQALEGLAVLHRAGRAHGSLSPDAWVIDPRLHRVRLVDLWSTWIPASRDERLRAYSAPELWDRAVPANEAERISGDVYAVGRLAEALLRGGAPMGAWTPLAPSPRLADEARRSFAMLSAWSARCQATAPGDRPPDAAAALEALRPLPIEGEVALARAAASLRLPYFTPVERALRGWSRSAPSSEPEPDALSYLGAVSSFRASLLWKALAVAAVVITFGSVGLAIRPKPPEEGEWSTAACVDAARPEVLEGPDAGGSSVLRLRGTAPEALALDGCPVAARPGLLLALAPGPHQLRAEAGGRKTAQAIDLAAGADLELSLDTLPIATENGSEAIATFRSGLRRLTDQVAHLRTSPATSAEAPPGAQATSYQQALIEPEVLALLELDRRYIAPSPGARANLPDGLALWLDALRAAASRFDATEKVCNRRAKEQVRMLLDQRQPEGAKNLSDAIEALAVGRILASEETNRPGDETAVLQALGVTDSPMLQRAVHDLVLDPGLRGCVEVLRPSAADLKALAAAQLAEYGEWTAWAHQP